MAEEIKLEVIKKTQDSLGKYFKKPPLTEKLLKKPPFRFLHDIISAVIKETGFLDGLFSQDELNSENIKDKDAKLAYLTKLIDVMKLITGSNLMVRPSKIIAGHEPTKTNELLQAIGKALDKKVSSAEAIEHYKHNRKKAHPTAKMRSTSREESKNSSSRQSSQSRKLTEKEKISTVEQKKRSTGGSRTTTKETKVQGNDKREKKREREKENDGRDIVGVEDAKVAKSASVEDRTLSSRSREPPLANISESIKSKPALSDSTNSPTREAKASANNSQMTQSSPDTALDSDSRALAEPKSKTNAENTVLSKQTLHSDIETRKNSEKEMVVDTDSKRKSSASHKSRDKIELSSSSQMVKPETLVHKMEHHPTFDNPGSPPPKSFNDSNVSANLISGTINSPKTSKRAASARPISSRPISARPISARPAAPRMRSKAEFIFNEDISTPMGTVNVIVENVDTEDEDDVENMVVVETTGAGDPTSMDGIVRTESELSDENGHLVAQILETQRELTNTDNVDVMPKKVEIIREWELGSKREREATIKEVDKLRSSIQTLTRATNPLGKLFDYLQEDIEMMQKELQEWRSQYNQLSEQLQQEQVLTQGTVEPMKETLKNIESNITSQLDQICQVKAAMVRNDQKIQRLLNGR